MKRFFILKMQSGRRKPLAKAMAFGFSALLTTGTSLIGQGYQITPSVVSGGGGISSGGSYNVVGTIGQSAQNQSAGGAYVVHSGFSPNLNTATSPPPGPVLNPANGHFYEFVPALFTWSQARAYAEGRVHSNGWRGHLATIQDAPENTFVTALVANGSTAWIGGFQPAGSAEPAGGWRWVTEEPMTYTNWQATEPDNSTIGGGGGPDGGPTLTDDSLALAGPGLPNPGSWQDAFGGVLAGFIVEYEPPAAALNPANGHYYELVYAPQNWSQARADAEARVFTNGWRGHLVTIQDAPENAFVTALVSNVAAVWIGGYQPSGSAEPAGGWRWSTSEAFAFTNWAPGEPSDFRFGVNSDSVLLNAVNVGNPGQWRAASGNYPYPQFYAYLVEYEPTVPVITLQPQSLIIPSWSNALFSVGVSGATPLTYQWCKNTVALPGETNAQLQLISLRRADSGLYSVAVSNAFGGTLSSNAVLRVVVPQSFANAPVRLGNGGFRLLFGDLDGGLLTMPDTTNLTVEVSTNFVNWTTLSSGFTITTNGQVQVDDTGSTNLSRRFYRVIER